MTTAVLERSAVFKEYVSGGVLSKVISIPREYKNMDFKIIPVRTKSNYSNIPDIDLSKFNHIKLKASDNGVLQLPKDFPADLEEAWGSEYAEV
jgi:hypothetical protein